MLGHAITTELQLLTARDRKADLAASFGSSRVTGSTREDDNRTASPAPPARNGRGAEGVPRPSSNGGRAAAV
jgi:hypothetical protein